MTERVEYIAIMLIHPNRLNPRLGLNAESLSELADSIRQVGVVEPLIVRPRNGEYEIVVGERRCRAARKAGLDNIPVIIREYSDDEVIELNLIENVQREDLSAVEKGNSVKELLERYPEKYPAIKSVSKKLGVTTSTIQRWLELVSAPREIQELIAPAKKIGVPRPKGKLDYDTAVTIVRKIEDANRQVEIARELARRPIYRRTARKVINKVSSQPERPVEDVIQEIVEAPYELPFRLNHMEPILNGVKIQTSRKGIPDAGIKEGAVIHAAVWEPHFTNLKIKGIERKKLGDFNEEDARREGGYALEEFREVWKGLHGEWNPDETVYIIHFERME